LRVGEEGNQENSPNSAGALRRIAILRPLPLSLEAEAPTHLLERDFNEMEDGLLNRVMFIPWSAVLSIRGITPEERVSREANEEAGGGVGSA
jgi:hypothetical protein